MAGRTISLALHTIAYTITPSNYTVTNDGTVSVTSPIAIDFIGTTDTLINNAYITGAFYAVLFAPGGPNRLVVEPHTSLSGTVSGGNSVGSGVVSTLELASNFFTGTIGGLGTKYIDFGSIVVDPGAKWLLSPGDTVVSGATLTNAGTLSGNGITLAGASFTQYVTGAQITVASGIAVYGNPSNAATVTNYGLIGGGTPGFGVYLRAGGTISNLSNVGAAGTITGAVGVRAASQTTLTNAGTITGAQNQAVLLLQGGRVTNQQGGTISAPKGVAIAASGATASVYNYGAIRSGTTVAPGISLSNGGSVTNGAGGVIAGSYGVIIAGGSGAVVNNGMLQANASGLPHGYGAVLKTGGGVTNQATGTIAGYIGVGISGAAGTVTNAGAIAGVKDAVTLAAGSTNRVIIDPGATFIGTIDGGNAAGSAVSTLELATGASAGNLTGGIGTQYIGFASVQVDSGAQWTISAAGTLAPVVLTDSGTLINAATLTNNNGTTGFGITLATGGALINQGSISALHEVAVSGRTGPVTVTNEAQIAGGSTIAPAISLAGGGALNNLASGHIFGGAWGNNAPLTVTNSGLIQNFSTYVSQLGTYRTNGAVLSLGGGGAVTNIGTGEIQSLYAGDGILSLNDPITVTNSGRIEGYDFGGAGVVLEAGGRITNLAGGVIGGNLEGVMATGDTTIVNYGTIGGVVVNAISLQAGFPGRVVVHPGAVFTGNVLGGDQPNVSALDTLELANNVIADAGTMTGLGSKYTGFSQVTVDAGANWHFTGGNTAGYGMALSVGGLLVNAGTLAIIAGRGNFDGTQPGGSGGNAHPGGVPVAVTQAGTLINDMIAAGGSGGAGGIGVAGDVTDGDLGGAGGAGGSGRAAVSIAAGGTFFNGAVFSGTATATGGLGGVGGAGGDAGNNAAHDGGAGGAGGTGGAGVYLSAGGLVFNRAIITGGTGGNGGNGGANFLGVGAAGGAGGAGIAGTSGTVTNYGAISGASGGAAGRGSSPGASGANGVGVSFAGGGTVTNIGEIFGAYGADAIDFGIGASRLIYAPGAVFDGTVNGGNTLGSGIVSTLELGTAAARGSLSAGATLYYFGSEFINFASVQVDPRASWALGSGNTLAAGVTLSDQGQLVAFGQTVVGGAVDISGVPNLAASGTVMAGAWTGISRLAVGDTGDGALFVADSGSVAAASVDIATGAGTHGTVTVSNGAFDVPDSSTLVVGDGGVGQLEVNEAGSVGGGTVIIGKNSGAGGSSVDVSGQGSRIVALGSVIVGLAGSAALSVSGGATVVANSLDAGNVAAGVGQISVSGIGSALSVSGPATVADDGTGELSVLAGATFAATNLTIGAQTDSSGAMVVSGSGSVVNLVGALNIGTALGTGDLTLGPGATIHAGVINQFGQVVDEGGLLDPTVLLDEGTDGGVGTIASDFVIDEGTIAANSKKAANGVELVSGTVVGGGTLTISGGTTLDGTTENSPGLLLLDNIGTLEVQGPVLNAAETTFSDNGTPIGTVTVFGTYDVVNSVVDVQFLKANEVLVLDDISGFAGTVASVFGNDRFVITGGTLSNLAVSNGTTLTMSDSGQGAGGTDRIMFSAPVSAANFSIVNGNTLQDVACFVAGTRIATAEGSVAVEDLRVGDRVLKADKCDETGPGPVVSDARYLPIVWIGQRAVNCAAHPKPETVWPVRIARGAFDESVPARDLFVSPDHAIYVENMLIPAKHLLNGKTIVQVKRRHVVYYHIELTRHDVVLAEGLSAETYLDTGDRTKFSGSAVTALHPDFSARSREALGCAPLIVTGPRLEAVRRRVNARAKEIEVDPLVRAVR